MKTLKLGIAQVNDRVSLVRRVCMIDLRRAEPKAQENDGRPGV